MDTTPTSTLSTRTLFTPPTTRHQQRPRPHITPSPHHPSQRRLSRINILRRRQVLTAAPPSGPKSTNLTPAPVSPPLANAPRKSWADLLKEGTNAKTDDGASPNPNVIASSVVGTSVPAHDGPSAMSKSQTSSQRVHASTDSYSANGNLPLAYTLLTLTPPLTAAPFICPHGLLNTGAYVLPIQHCRPFSSLRHSVRCSI